MSSWKKYVKIGPYSIGVLIVLIVAAVIRISLIEQGWPNTNSDEGIWGLMSLHIAYRGEHPIYMYGQSYMGTLEAYMGAIFFQWWGPSLFALRFGMVCLFTLFLLIIYRLATLLYTRNVALISIALLALGSRDTYTRQLIVVGGALETQIFGALILLFATLLALSVTQEQEATPRLRRQQLQYAGGLGLAMGLGIWSHMLIVAFILPAGVFLILLAYRLLARSTKMMFWAGLLVGLLPVIIYSVINPAENAVATLWDNFRGGSQSPPHEWWYQFLGTFSISLPMQIGANPLYPITADPGKWQAQVAAVAPQLGWSAGYLLLWGIAVWLAVRVMRRQSSHRATSDERRLFVLGAARLMMQAGTALTILAFFVSSLSGQVPVTNSRYLVGILVGTPALVAVLCSAWPQDWSQQAWLRSKSVFKSLILVCIFVILLNGTVATFANVPAIQANNQRQMRLIQDLTNMHIVHIYTDYWTCGRLMFASSERIICSPLDNKLRNGQYRYRPYYEDVHQDKDAAYVLGIGSQQNSFFLQNRDSSGQYLQSHAEGYVIYQPSGK